MYDYSPIVYYYEDSQEVRISLTKNKSEFLSFCIDKELINKILNILTSTENSFGSFSTEKSPTIIYITRYTFTIFNGTRFKFSFQINKHLLSLLVEIGQFLNSN